MPTIEKSIEVHVPVRTAYNQWTQFEMFPKFMPGIDYIRQVDDTTLVWKADLLGKDEEWTARITEQTPDQRIAWTSVTGVKNAGVVTFHYIDDNRCKVMVQIDYDPEGFVENAGSILGIVDRYVSDSMRAFKEIIEKRPVETGAWRGTVEQDKVNRR